MHFLRFNISTHVQGGANNTERFPKVSPMPWGLPKASPETLRPEKNALRTGSQPHLRRSLVGVLYQRTTTGPVSWCGSAGRVVSGNTLSRYVVLVDLVQNECEKIMSLES